MISAFFTAIGQFFTTLIADWFKEVNNNKAKKAVGALEERSEGQANELNRADIAKKNAADARVLSDDELDARLRGDNPE